MNKYPEAQTVNWMLEDFPAEIKQKCKEQAVLQRQTLKSFVETVLREAIRKTSIPTEGHRQKLIDPGHGSPKPVAKSRDKGPREPTKAKARVS